VFIHLSRGSVAAGDDIESHDENREVDGRRPLALFVHELLRDQYLPSIHGGKATWIVRTSRNGTAIGVVSTRQGHPEPLRFIDGADRDLSEVGGALYFEYAAQRDPAEVFDSIA
jgi:hypothetical protein